MPDPVLGQIVPAVKPRGGDDKKTGFPALDEWQHRIRSYSATWKAEATYNNASSNHYEMMHNENTRVTAISLRQTLCSHWGVGYASPMENANFYNLDLNFMTS